MMHSKVCYMVAFVDCWSFGVLSVNLAQRNRTFAE